MTPKDSKCPNGHSLEFYNHDTQKIERAEECLYCKSIDPKHEFECFPDCGCDVNHAPLDGVKRYWVWNTNKTLVEVDGVEWNMVDRADHEAALKALNKRYNLLNDMHYPVIMANDSLRKQVDSLESSLKAKEEEILKLKEVIAFADSTLANQNIQLKDKDARIAYYKSENEKLTQQNNDKDWKLSDKDARIAELEAVLNLGGEGSLLVNQERHLMRLEVALNSAESKLKIARDDLRKYGNHIGLCKAYGTDCTCGLEKALEDLK
jgi:chromosome segregation ATPase